MANSVDSDQTGFSLFAHTCLSEYLESLSQAVCSFKIGCEYKGFFKEGWES